MLHDAKRWERKRRYTLALTLAGLVLIIIGGTLAAFSGLVGIPNWIMVLFGLVGAPLGLAQVGLSAVLRKC